MSQMPKDVLTAIVVAIAGLVVWTVAHELTHVGINFAATGTIASCGDIGPIGISNNRLYACYAERGVGAWNDLLTPVLMSAAGLTAVYLSDWIAWRPGRWGVAGAGIVVWAADGFYSMGFWTPPNLTATGVHYSGDGIDALTAFGRWAMVPGLLLIAIGFWVVQGRVQYERR